MSEQTKKWNFDLRDKNTWLIIGMIGLLLLVLALPSEESGQQEEAQTTVEDVSDAIAAETETSEITTLERRLEETLSLIDGAGEVRVMLTLKDSGEKVIEKDTTSRTGSMENVALDVTESTVFTKNGSEETPYVSNELTPQVEGVLVVAQGGGNSLVKQNILQSVMALFPLEAHKITIVKMSMQEVREQ